MRAILCDGVNDDEDGSWHEYKPLYRERPVERLFAYLPEEHMKSRLHLKPGQKGTKSLVEKYGDDLVCVRYRYDEESRTRIKTVELIVERKELPPAVRRIKDDALVPVQIVYGETELGKMARKMGGKWASDVKLWYIEFGKIKGTELEKHIILDTSKKGTVE